MRVSEDTRTIIRVLIVDDEADVRDAYRQILVEKEPSEERDAYKQLRARLFAKTPDAGVKSQNTRNTRMVVTFCDGARAAVEAVQEALAAGEPFAVAFLDMRMPPGPDGVWAAARIRELDPVIEIVVCTAYSDVDPGQLGGMVPPEEKLSYLQKPFHPHEIRQMTLSLASKWRAEHHISKLVYFDSLTGLPNRERSRSFLSSALGAARTQQAKLAVLYLDLDKFKRVNDTLGHAQGDELLCVIAARLRDELGVNHIGRLGGDEFVVILPAVDSADEAAATAARLIAAVQARILLAQNTLVITPSIGIAMYPADAIDGEVLLKNAGLAMYASKRKSSGMFARFDAAMNESAMRCFTLEAELRGALARNEFTLNYQPQFDVGSGAISGMEALLRWTHAELGAVSPAEFIPVAEDTGLILPIGEWAMRQACEQTRAWLDEGLEVPRMAINVSGQQFALKSFPATVARIIRESGIEPSMIELEITESVVMNDEAWAKSALHELKQLGVFLAIDDFGTGHSSFGRLRNFTVDRLKIDQSFIRSLTDCSDDRAIAAAIISMSRSLRISVTAEGVESFPQLLFLQEHECQDAQGFLFSRALPVADAHDLLVRAVEARSASRSQRLRVLIG